MSNYRWRKIWGVYTDTNDTNKVGSVVKVDSRTGTTRNRIVADVPMKGIQGQEYRVFLLTTEE